jgi:hypothetical protein
MNGSPVAGLVRRWVDLYTRGLTTELRAARRDEIDDDLWCQHDEAVTCGRSARSLGAELLVRLLFGMPADVSWRLANRGRTPANLERTLTTGTRGLGVVAIVAGVSWTILFVLFVPLSHALWAGTVGVFGLTGTIIGAVAFAATALGLGSRFADRIGALGGFGQLLVTVGALTSLVGFIPPLVVGSAMLMWDLARIGVVRWRVPVVHVAAAILTVALAIATLDLNDAGNRVLLAAVLAPFLLTWVTTGVSLYRDVPPVEHASVR